MADDIASVGIKIETGDIDRANVSLDTLAGKGASVDQSLGKIEGAAAKAGKSLDNLGRGAQSAAGIGDVGAKAQHAAQGIRAVGDNAEKAGHGVKSMAASMGGFGDVLSGIAMKAAAAAGAFVSLNKAFDAAAQWTDMSNRLKMVADGADGLARAQAEVVRIAQATRAPLEATAQLYQRIAQQQDALGMSTSRVAGVVETVSKAMALSGVSAGAANAALVQFGQALASGVLRGDELNSILEQAPGLAMALAEGLGTTTGKLREMGAQGQLTADMVVGALEKQAGAINEQFGKMAPTFSQALTNVNTAFTQFVGKLDEATGLTAGLARTVDFLAKNFDTLAIVLGGSAIVGAVAAFGGLGAAIAAVGTAAAVLGGLLLTPIGLAVAAVVGLTAGYIAFKDELNGTGDAAITLGDIFGEVGRGIINAFGSAQDAVKKTGDASADAAENTIGYWEKGIRGVAALMDKLASLVSGTVLGVGEAMGNVAKAMTDVFARAFNWIAEKAESFINSISRGVNSVTGLLGVNQIGAVSFGRAGVSGAQFDVGGAFRRGMEMGQTTYWGDMAGGFIDSIRSQKALAATRAAGRESARNTRAQMAKETRDLADAESRLEAQRIKALKVDKEYQQTLTDLQALRDAGRISEAEYITKVEALAKATWESSAAGKADADSKKSRAKASDDAAKAAEREANAFKNFIASLHEKVDAEQQEFSSSEKLTKAEKVRLDLQKQLEKGAFTLTAARKAETEAALKALDVAEQGNKLRKAQADFEQDRTKYFDTLERETGELTKKNIVMQEEIEAMGLTKRQLADLERARLDSAIAKHEERLATIALYDATGEETKKIREQIAALRERQSLIGQQADKQEFIDNQRAIEDEAKKTADSINQSLTDALLRGFEDGKGFASNFRDTLKNMFRTLVLRPIISFVVQPIGNLIQGAIGGLLGGGQGGAGNLLGTASNMQSAYQWLSGGYQDTFRSAANFFGFGGSAAAPAVSYGGQALTGLTWGGKPIASSAVTGFNGTALSQSPGMTISAAGIAAIAAPLIIGSLIERNSRDRFSGAAYATSGGNDPFVNTVAGSTGFDYLTGDLPDRAALLARLGELGAPMEAISDWNDRALLRLMESAAADNSEFGINWTSRVRDMRDTPDFYRGAGYAHPEELGWWNNKDNANLSTDPALIQASRDIALSIIGPLEGIGALIGDEAAYRATVGFANRGEGNGLWAGLNLQRDGQNVADWVNTDDFHSVGEAVRAMYSTALGTLDSFDLPGWADKQVTDARAALDALEGENMGQEAAALYAQTTAGIEQMYRSIQMLIDVFPDFSAATQDSVFALQELMGGMDQLQGAYSSYLQNFWSDEERADLMRKQLGLELGKVGLSLPETRDAFRDLVEAQDLSTEAGREAFAALMGVAGAFAEITPAAESAAEAAARHTDDVWNRLNQLFNEQIDNWRGLADEARKIFDLAGNAARQLRGGVDSTRLQDARTANAYIDQALAGLRATGALPDSKELADAIEAARGGLDMSQYDTVAEMERDQLILAGKLNEIGDSAEVQMSFAEQQVQLLEQQRDYWRQQIDLLNATGETITSIDQGIEYLADYVREQTAIKAAEEAEKEAAREAARRAYSGGYSPGDWGGGGWGGGGGQDLTSITRTINWDTGEYVYPDGSGGTLSPEELEHFRRILDGELDPTRIIDDLYQVPRHADGGRYAGGLALVGERGPELINFASPGHIYTADQTRDMMRGGDNAELIAELRELRARLDKIERNTAVLPQTHDVIDRVTAGGNAMLTEAA